MQIKIIIILSILVLRCEGFDFVEDELPSESICEKINLSTNSTESKNDIVKNGRVETIWKKKWDFEYLEGVNIQPSKLVDYLYLYTTEANLTVVRFFRSKSLRTTIFN